MVVHGGCYDNYYFDIVRQDDTADDGVHVASVNEIGVYSCHGDYDFEQYYGHLGVSNHLLQGLQLCERNLECPQYLQKKGNFM